MPKENTPLPNLAEENEIVSSPPSFPKIPLVMIGLLILLAAGAYYLYAQRYIHLGNIQPPAPAAPIPSLAPSPEGGIRKNYNSEGFDNCLFNKGQDKLITLAEIQKDGTLFVAMAGNIMDVQSNSDQTTIALIAPDGSQGYQFTLPSSEQIVWTSLQATTAKTVSELKSFLSVQVYGSCDPKATGKKLTINQINIVTDLTKPKR